ncbi:MAG: glycosyltransferase family 4 protein [Bacteroidota bacterium]|nr:MAG: glycosyltransferase family 4 protein [Bacteroidota bacterium]
MKANEKTICMLSDMHGLFDDRIYWKEAVSLKKYGFNLIHIGFSDKEEDYISNEGIRIISIPRLKYSKIFLFDRIIKTILFKKPYNTMLKKIKQTNAQVYTVHDLKINAIIRKIKKLPQKPKLIYCIHEDYPDMIRDYTQRKGLAKILRFFYATLIEKWEIKKSTLYDYVIAFDDATFNKFNRLRNNTNTDLIYNFAEIDEIITDQPEKKWDICYVGSISKQRGILELIEAISLTRSLKKDISLLILGTIHDKIFDKIIRDKISKLSLESNIILHDAIDHKKVSEYIRSCRIGMVTLLPIPKYFKNIPIKQFEYMACGLPVIGSNLPPIRKFVDPSNSGIIVNPESPSDISSAIIKLLNDKKLYSELSENAYKAAINHYNWKISEKKMYHIYSTLLL